MHLSVVILAAGQGKRMNSDLPKVLQPLAGEPLLQHVIRAARALNPSDIYVVYGHGGAQVQAVLAHEKVEWVLQADQLGTGHAVMQAMCLIPDEHTVLVLYGDVPLIGAASLAKLLAAAGERALAILSVNLDEARGYGRIVRNADGQVIAIVEHKDASDQQRQISEVNSGIYIFRANKLWPVLDRLEKQMHDASEALDFEWAARIRDQLLSVRKVCAVLVGAVDAYNAGAAPYFFGNCKKQNFRGTLHGSEVGTPIPQPKRLSHHHKHIGSGSGCAENCICPFQQRGARVWRKACLTGHSAQDSHRCVRSRVSSLVIGRVHREVRQHGS